MTISGSDVGPTAPSELYMTQAQYWYAADGKTGVSDSELKTALKTTDDMKDAASAFSGVAP